MSVQPILASRGTPTQDLADDLHVRPAIAAFVAEAAYGYERLDLDFGLTGAQLAAVQVEGDSWPRFKFWTFVFRVDPTPADLYPADHVKGLQVQVVCADCGQPDWSSTVRNWRAVALVMQWGRPNMYHHCFGGS